MQGASGEAFADDALVEKGAAPSSYNLLDDIDNWNMGLGTSLSFENPTGKTAIEINTGESSFNSAGNITRSVIKQVPVYKNANTTFLVSAWAYLDTTPDYAGRTISIDATIFYSDSQTETIRVPFNINVQKKEHFMQGIIVPQNRDGFIDTIELKINYINLSAW